MCARVYAHRGICNQSPIAYTTNTAAKGRSLDRHLHAAPLRVFLNPFIASCFGCAAKSYPPFSAVSPHYIHSLSSKNGLKTY
jgi:hypothetical protein